MTLDHAHVLGDPVDVRLHVEDAAQDSRHVAIVERRLHRGIVATARPVRQTLVQPCLVATVSGYRTTMVTKDDVVEALHGVEDPELGMDIVELGLYYDSEIEGERVKVIHSLTSMGCPAGPMIQENIHEVVAALPGVEQVEVELTFDPPWTPDRMSDDAKFILGFG